jgi:hypothetical protein
MTGLKCWGIFEDPCIHSLLVNTEVQCGYIGGRILLLLNTAVVATLPLVRSSARTIGVSFNILVIPLSSQSRGEDSSDAVDHLSTLVLGQIPIAEVGRQCGNYH